MEAIDKNITPIYESEVPFINTALRYGLIGGAFSIVTTLMMHLTGISDGSNGSLIMSSIISMLVVFVLYIGCQIMAIRTHRNSELGGYITFKRAFMVTLVVTLIIGVISALFNYIYLNFIDPDYISRFLGNMQDFLESYDVPEDQIEQTLEETAAGLDPSLLGSLKSTFYVSIFGALIGVIVAAVMKKETPLR